MSKRAAERFRGLGKQQNAPLNVSEGSEGIPAKLAGYKSNVLMYPAFFVGVRRRPPVSVDARRRPERRSEARAGTTATARAAAPRSAAIAVAVAAAPQIVTAVR